MKQLWKLLLAPLLLVGCGDDDPTSPTESRFTAQAEGAVTTSFDGAAFFGQGQDAQGEPVFTIVLATALGEQIIGFARPGTSRPAVGEYTLVASEERPADQWYGVYLRGTGDTVTDLFVSSVGTLRITSSSSQRLEGTFEFVGQRLSTTGTPTEDPVEATFTGSFEAIPDARFAAGSRVRSSLAPAAVR